MSLEAPPHKETPIVNDKGLQTPIFFRWAIQLVKFFNTGIDATVPLAKITPSGTDGSLTFTNGILTSKVSPT